MATETMAEFLARGGKIEKSSTKETLSELLQKEGILNQQEAEKVSHSLNESLEKALKPQD